MKKVVFLILTIWLFAACVTPKMPEPYGFSSFLVILNSQVGGFMLQNLILFPLIIKPWVVYLLQRSEDG